MNKTTNRLILRFLSVFLLSMFAPVLFITTILISNINQREYENIKNDIDNKTSNIARVYEDMLANAKNINIVLNNKSEFFNFSINSYAGNKVYIEQELVESEIQSSLVENINFYSKTTGLVYGASSYFLDSYLSIFNEETQGKFIEAFAAKNPSWITNHEIIQSGITRNQISYVMPFERNYNSENYFSYLIINYSHEDFLSYFNALNQYENASFYVMQGEEIIFSHINSEEFSAYADIDFIKNVQASGLQNINGKEYYLSVAKAQEDIQVYAFIQKDVLFANGETYRYLYWVYAAISLVVGSLVIVVFVKRNYVPIFKMHSSFEKFGLNLDFSEKFFQEVTTTMQELNYSSSEASEEVIRLQRDSILFKLFNIKFTEENRKDIYEICKLAQINVERELFACVVFSVISDFVSSTNFILEKNDNYDIYEYHYIHSNTVVVLIATDEKTKHIVGDFTRDILNQSKIAVRTCGVSTFKTDFLDINTAYQEAYLSANCCFQLKERCLKFTDIDNQISVDRATILRESGLLKNAISEKDIDKIMFAFNLLTASLNTITDINALRIYCFEISNKCLENYNNIPQAEKLNCEEDISALFEFDAEHIVAPTQVLTEIIKKIIQNVEIINKNTKAKLNIESVKDKIQEKLLDSNFSIKQLADEYGTSVSNLSHFFKTNEKCNISDYISVLKHDIVKEMLLHTNHPIAYIAEYVGYTHTSNFIKKFKLQEGVTPNQYRIKNKK